MLNELLLFAALVTVVVITAKQPKASKRPKRKRRRRAKKKQKKKKIRSGNGTAAKQWLYVLVNFPKFWTCKIGITGYLDLRVQQIDEDNQGKDVLVWAIKIWAAYQVEQFIHSLCFFMRDRSFHGTGRTERFLVLAIIPAVVISILAWSAEYIFYLAIIAFIFYTITFKL